MIYRMKLADSVDEMTFDLLEVPIEDKDIEGATDNTTIDGNIFTDYLWLKKQFVQKWSLMCKDDYTQLRGFYTRQWENAEAPTYTLFAGQNRSETLTASGSAFQIQNGTQYDAPLTLTELKGNATQTTYSGKNLLPLKTTATISGITFTNNGDGSFNLSGTATAAVEFSIVIPQAQSGIVGGQNYTISSNYAIDGNLTYYVHSTTEAGKWKKTLLSFTTAGTRTAPEPTTDGYIKFVIRIENGANMNGYNNVRTMIEKGSSATSFEPYVGGTSAPNPEFPMPISVVTGENTVKITGKNLINENGERSSQYINGNGNFVVGVSNGYVNQQIPTKPNTAYTFSASSKTTQNVYIRIGEYKANGSFIKRNLISSLNQTITTDAECYILKTCIDVSPGNHFTNPQLELGSTATAYEPYQGQEHPIDLGSIELCKIGNYQDRIYKTGGKWYVEKQVGKLSLANIDWVASPTTTTGVYRMRTQTAPSDVAPPINNTTKAAILSSAYKVMTAADAYTALETGIAIQSDTPHIFVYDPNYNLTTSPTAFKTKMESISAVLYYALATPTTTEITDTTLLAQLNFIANLYGGTNNIMLVGTGAQGEIGVEYTLTYEKEQTIIPETTVRLTLTDGGVINTCECRQNVQLTMRETVQ